MAWVQPLESLCITSVLPAPSMPVTRMTAANERRSSRSSWASTQAWCAAPAPRARYSSLASLCSIRADSNIDGSPRLHCVRIMRVPDRRARRSASQGKGRANESSVRQGGRPDRWRRGAAGSRDQPAPEPGHAARAAADRGAVSPSSSACWRTRPTTRRARAPPASCATGPHVWARPGWRSRRARRRPSGSGRR